MKTLALCLALLTMGCSTPSVNQDDVAGTYSQNDIDAEFCIRISKDGSYETFALISWKMTEGADGTTNIPSELRERGRWSLSGTTLTLYPENGQERSMQVRVESQTLVLRDQHHRFKMRFQDSPN